MPCAIFTKSFVGMLLRVGDSLKRFRSSTPGVDFPIILSAPLAAKPYAFLYYQTEPVEWGSGIARDR